MSTNAAITLHAHAKLNLILSVGAPEPAESARAGWHRILSWFSCIDLADELRVERLSEGRTSEFHVSWAEDAPLADDAPRRIDWPIERDLCVRAHAVMEERIGRALPVCVTLRKRIPTGAGLGGGSSDCAAMLLALRELFSLSVNTDELRRVGASLGSDVAFFLDDRRPPRPAIVSGFGATVERTGSLHDRVVLVIPPFSCATPEVYKAFDLLLQEEQREDALRRARMDLSGPGRTWGPRERLVRGRVDRMLAAGRLDASLLRNDLARAAFRIEPRLGELSRALSRITRLDAHVTGSGSCLFIVPPAGRVEWVLERASRVAGGARVLTAELLGSSTYPCG